MTYAIAWFLLGLATLGALAAIAMLIELFIATNRSDQDLYLRDYECDCPSCAYNQPLDICSSECDDACAANEHCSAPDPWCGCPSCTNHRLDELPPRTENE